LGDSYAGGKGTCFNPGGGKGSFSSHGDRKDAGIYPLDRGNVSTLRASGLKPKDLVGIPWRVALALQANGWWLRSDIIWNKPNPMPESVTDRPTKAHEYIFLLTKNQKYYYDAEAIKESQTESSINRAKYPWHGCTDDNSMGARTGSTFKKMANSNGPIQTIPKDGKRNKRSVWTIATEPTPEAHFATFPEKLVIPCIKAGTSEKGCCPECGAPWLREVEKQNIATRGNSTVGLGYRELTRTGQSNWGDSSYSPGVQQVSTIGWRPTCDCNAGDPVPCTVLDPFSGSGKVLIVAKKLFRKAIGIELNSEYCEMPVKKLAPGRFDFK